MILDLRELMNGIVFPKNLNYLPFLLAILFEMGYSYILLYL